MKLGRRGGGEKDACLSRRLGRQLDPHYFGHDRFLSIKKNVLLMKPCHQGNSLESGCKASLCKSELVNSSALNGSKRK